MLKLSTSVALSLLFLFLFIKPLVANEVTYSTYSTPIIQTAQRYLGVNPTGRRSLWCADFLNLVLKQNGLPGTQSRTARAFHTYGRPSTGQVGDIAIMHRGRRGGHVGIVVGTCDKGVRILSGNFGRQKVGYGCYPRNKIKEFRAP